MGGWLGLLPGVEHSHCLPNREWCGLAAGASTSLHSLFCLKEEVKGLFWYIPYLTHTHTHCPLIRLKATRLPPVQQQDTSLHCNCIALHFPSPGCATHPASHNTSSACIISTKKKECLVRKGGDFLGMNPTRSLSCCTSSKHALCLLDPCVKTHAVSHDPAAKLEPNRDAAPHTAVSLLADNNAERPSLQHISRIETSLRPRARWLDVPGRRTPGVPASRHR